MLFECYDLGTIHLRKSLTTILVPRPHPSSRFPDVFNLKTTWGLAHRSYGPIYESLIQDALGFVLN